MNYLVMEIHPAYAVVMDEEGRFLKAAQPALSGGRHGAEHCGTALAA